MAEDNLFKKLELRIELALCVKDKSVDVTRVREIIKDRYKRLCFMHHPDRNKELDHSFIARVSSAYSELHQSSDEDLRKFVLSYVQENSESAQLVRLAQKEISRLDEKLEQAYSDLRETQAAMIKIAQDKKNYKVGDILVFHEPRLRIRITLENAVQEISKLLNPEGLDTILREKLRVMEQELQESQRQIKDYRNQEAALGNPSARIKGLELEVAKGKADHTKAMSAAEELVVRVRREYEEKLAKATMKYGTTVEYPGAVEERELVLKIETAQKQGQFKEALQQCAKLNSLVPGSAAATYYAGRILEQAGKLGGAGRFYHQTVQRDSEHYLAQQALDRIRSKMIATINNHLSSHDYEQAMKWCAELRTINPEDVQAICLSAKAYQAQGKYKEAEEYYRKLPWMKEMDAALDATFVEFDPEDTK